MLKTMGYISSIILFIGTIFGIFWWLEKRYCHADTFQIFAQSTKYELKSNQIEKLNERRWQLEKRLKDDPNDETTIEDLKSIAEMKEKYKKELEELGKVK